MSKSVINDIPGQGFLWDSFRPHEESRIAREDHLDNWLDERIGNERIGLAKVYSCNPDKCVDDCNKCRIFGK